METSVFTRHPEMHVSDGPGPLLATLSRRLVQVMRRQVGRGPTRAKSHWAGPDVVITLFGDCLLRSEKTLWANGQAETATAYRRAIQATIRPEMSDEVERLLGRRVTAVMDSVDHDADLIAQIFVLEPELEREFHADGAAG